jgi:hypothetical protein
MWVYATVITIPRKLVEELERRGVDASSFIIDLMVKALNLDPNVAAESHLELSLKYLEEGRALIDKDPIQASEKLYKAAEEAVKALVIRFNLSKILTSIERRGRWSFTELEEAVINISEKLGEWFRASWDAAWALHVWGFHEAKFSPRDVRIRLPDIEKIILEARKILTSSPH